MEGRQVPEAGVPAEELVAAGAHQGHRESGIADGTGHDEGVQPVECRLVDRIQRPIELLHEIRLGQEHLLMVRPDGLGHPACDPALVELLLLEGQGEGVHRSAAGAVGEVGDRG